MTPSVEQLQAILTRYQIIDELLDVGMVAGAYAPAVVESRRFIQLQIKQIQEHIDGTKDTPSDQPNQEAAGVGSGGVPDKRRRKSRKQEGK